MGTTRALLHTIKVHMGLSIARPMFQFVIWFSPLFVATLAILIYGADSPERIFNYVVLGSGFMSLWTAIVYSSASDINRERFYGTLEIIFVAPASFAVILIGKIIGNTIWGLLSMMLAAGYLYVLFDVRLTIHHTWLFPLTACIALVSLTLFSFFLALIFTLSRQAYALMNLIEYPIYLICGFLFPVSILPVWVQPLSYILPPTWAIALLRQAAEPQLAWSDYRTSLYALLFLVAIYGGLSVFCYKAVQHKARVNGQLGVH